LKGEITNYRRRRPSENDKIGYRFVTPEGYKIDAEQLIPRKGMQGAMNRLVHIEIGTPVAVLYVDDDRYMLL
jgi:hypothetical protein